MRATPLPSRLATRLATALIPPGPVRDRYRQEFAAELADLTVARRPARAVSLLLGAPALHRALVEAGDLDFPHSSWWCRARLHHRWQRLLTTDGARFRRCRDCGIDDDETALTPATALTGAALRGPPV